MSRPKVRPVSVNDAERLEYLKIEALRAAEADNGDFIEMGVLMGGSAALMANCIRRVGGSSILHLCDSWEGPRPLTEEDKGAIGAGKSGALGGGDFETVKEAFSSASREEVEAMMQELELIEHCRFHQGYFDDTLPGIQGPFSLAHVDCDYYAPVKFCLETVLPQLAPEGVVVVDDYGNEGSRRFPGVVKAVSETLEEFSDFKVEPLGGRWDQSVRIVRK